MSPKVAVMVSGRRAQATARSTYPTGVTHTGQPGPEIRRTPAGRRVLMPYW